MWLSNDSQTNGVTSLGVEFWSKGGDISVLPFVKGLATGLADTSIPEDQKIRK